MTVTQAHHVGDPRVSPALASHLERHRGDHHAPHFPLALVAHTGLRPALSGVRRIGASVVAWPVRSQRRALRNAMVASTALVERRIERDEVEQFLADRQRQAAPVADITPALR